jgi:DNA polymerase III subunit alpha
MSKFVHLHLHTQFSLLDGANKISNIIKRASALNQEAIALTDHGNMHGAIDFFLTAQKQGIKPIIGCELYVTKDRKDRTPAVRGGASTNHLTALAANQTGYQNLCKLVSLAYKEGFYFKPRVDRALLEELSEGIIILSGCLASEVSQSILNNNEEELTSTLEFYAKHFSNRYYLEIQPHQIQEQQKVNEALVLYATKMGLPLVGTTDCHYETADDHFAQEVLMCISTGKTVLDPDRLKHDGVTLHLKTYEEMLSEFGNGQVFEESLSNTSLVADACNLDFNFNTYYMPRFSSSSEEVHTESMARNARVALSDRVDFASLSNDKVKEYQDRLERELSLIEKMGFASYFLVVSDFIIWAKEQGIPVGPGRGSVAGSLVAYALRITEVDPIKYSLLFERFLNPDRVSLPDIDVDFCIYGRARVIKYVCEKYGNDKVAQICTFGTLKAKAAIKDVGRALGLSYAETDKVAQLIPAPRQGFDYSIADALSMEPRLKEYAEQGKGQEHISLALKLEGLTRHSSTHAAGVVIGDRPLMELLPMMVDKEGNDVTQFSMGNVEKIGLVKFDFLGLKTLTVIQTALEIIAQENEFAHLNPSEFPLDDELTYKTLCEGNTTGIFQLESTGISEMTMRLKPNCFEDIVAILALYRPGPLDAGMVDRYIERKHQREKVTYLHPLMEEILSSTYGIMLYQEQIMQLAQALAGYTLAEADILRKAMGKKNPEEMAKQKDRFVQGCTEAKIPLKTSEEIFSQMETFARYGFNRSHSVAYAIISFQTAYLKAHHPVAFMAALMTHDSVDSDKVLKNISECRKQNIAILPPDVNKSTVGFSTEGSAIRFGLAAVKGLGEKIVSEIVNVRGQDPFVSIENFLERNNPRTINRKTLESLIYSGAFDQSKISRKELIQRVDQLLHASHQYHDSQNSLQLSLFSRLTDQPTGIVIKWAKSPEWPMNILLKHEREALGFYITSHPLLKFRDSLPSKIVTTQNFRLQKGGAQVQMAGVVTGLRLRNTKKGERYASFVLEDEFGTIEALMWPDIYKKFGHFVEVTDPVIFLGKADVTDERAVYIIELAELLSERTTRVANIARLTLNGSSTNEETFMLIKSILERHPGTCPIFAHYTYEGATVELRIPITINPTQALCNEVESLSRDIALQFCEA